MTGFTLTRRTLMRTATGASGALFLGALTATPANAEDGPSTLRVSTLGYDPVNSTRFLQAAFDSDVDVVIVDKVAGGWPTDALFIRRDNLTVLFEPGATIQARIGGFKSTQDRLLQLENCSNVRLSGYGATLQMNKLDYRDGEWRNALRLVAVTNSTIEGLTLRDSGGDGVGLTGPAGSPCKNIVLRDLIVNNNKRNAITLGSVDGVLVQGCVFFNTVGTAPQAGADLEPDTPGQVLKNVRFVDCIFENNASCGFQLETQFLNRDSAPINVLVERTTIGSQVGGSPQVMIYGQDDSPGGTFELRDSLIRVEPGSAAVGTLRLPRTAYQAHLTRVSIWDLGNPKVYYEPIFCAARGLDTYGNLAITDCTVVTDQPATVLKAHDQNTLLCNVTGNLSVVNPNGVALDLGTRQENVAVNATERPQDTNTEVRVVPLTARVDGGETVRFKFIRSGGRPADTLGVAYKAVGSAVERYDFGGRGNVVTFAPGQNTVEVEVPTYARRQDSDPRERSLALAILPGPQYQPSNIEAHCDIVD